MTGSDDFEFGEFAEREVEIIVFEVGGNTYAADASLVQRIDRPDEGSIVRDDLGALNKGNRAIVFAGPGAQGSLRVDAVRGVRNVDVNSLRQLPKAAQGKNSCAMGVWLSGEGDDRPVLLIDLFATLKSS